MSQVITNAFEQYWQSSLAAEQPVVLDEFILADIPNLDITSPIDPDAGLPPDSQIVHRQNVDQRGRINTNAVAYSIVMDTTVGDFSFNAMYLRNKANGVIGMIVYKGRETKLKTDQTTGQTGNSLVKSMLMGYDQAAEATLTNVDAGTWQIDYAARLRGQDEDLRQLASQLYGHHTFIGDGFKIVQLAGGHQVTPGAAIVGGLRVELSAPELIYPGSKPIGVWVDVHRAGSLLSEHQNHFTIITSVADLTDHVDGSGYQHYVAKLGTVQADNTVLDRRGQGGGSGAGGIPDTFALWKRSMAEAGYDLIGQFGDAHAIETANQVLLSKDGTKVYAWNGGLPKTVVAAYTPSTEPGMWTDRSEAPNAFKQRGTGAVPRTAQDKMGERVSVLDFTGATNAKKFINALTYLNDSGGGTLRINRGVNFLIEDTILSPILSGDIDIYFEPGSVLTAAPGLSVPVLNMLASGSTITERILRIFNPRIDCSKGFADGAGQACTAISAQYFKQFIVEYPYLFGGDDYRNTNADSGITPIDCDYFSLLGGRIRGFSDGGVYIGGDNTAGLTGDTISSIILNTNFERCATAVAAKRDLTLLKVTHAHITECLAGIVPSEITTPSYTNPARRLHVTDCHFKKIGSQAARFRGPTKGIFARNHIEDWGYESDGVTPLTGSAYALALQGSSGIDVDGNEYKLVDWASNDQRAVLLENITLNSVAYTQGGNNFSNNKYRDIPRVLVEAPGGNPSTYLHEHYDNITTSKFSGLHPSSLVLYRENSADRLWSLLHGVVQPVGRAPVVAHTSAVTLSSTDSGGVFTNVGATALVALTLPGAAAGLTYEFACMDTDGLRINAAAGDNIRISGSVSSSGGTATSTTVGTTLKLTALDSTNWVADYVTGTWTLA